MATGLTGHFHLDVTIDIHWYPLLSTYIQQVALVGLQKSPLIIPESSLLRSNSWPPIQPLDDLKEKNILYMIYHYILLLIIIIIGRNPLGLAPPGLEESGPPSAAVTAPTVAPDGPLVADDHLGTDLSDDGTLGGAPYLAKLVYKSNN